MKNLKKILIALFILLIITILIIIILSNTMFKRVNKNINTYENNLSIIRNIELVDNPIMYFTVKSCADKYITSLNEKNTDEIYNLLDGKYIQEFSITKENVLNYVEQPYETSELEIEEMYIEKIDENNETYYIKGILLETTGGHDTVYGEEKEIKLTVLINHDTMTFTIIPFGHGGVFDE